ncbi:hypothetical protein [Roseovarius arcticus]|uniref:hypothetical protein n=1 Tax=Roseovarius arcticus TaxID=2547404 RepID=UPI001110ADC6|nr:hypothetical protein [Roseovarius arcticus]
MIELAILVTKVSGLCLAFFLCWSVLIFGAVREMDAKSAENRTPGFVIRVKGPAKASIALMIVPAVYAIWTGSLDTFFYTTASAGFLIGAFACWRAATSLGSYALEAEAKWREIKFKTYLQAFGLILLIIAFEQGRAYFETLV